MSAKSSARKRAAWLALLLGAGASAGPAALAQTSGVPKDPAASIANFLFWQGRINKATPAADDLLYVLMHSSRDCGYCQRWKKDPSGLEIAKMIVGAAPNVRIFIVERATLDDAELQKQYPAELQFEYERRFVEGHLSPAVPEFEIFLRGTTVYRGSGLDVWVNRVVPAIVNIEKRREGAAAEPK